MAKFDTKVNGDTVDDVAYNNIVTELKNAITTTGEAIDATQIQLSESLPSYAAVSTFYTDSGAADAYVLTPITTFKSPPSYINGMLIRFRAGNAGTGGAATVNVNGAGVKSLKEADGSTNPSSIPTTEDSLFRYDGTVFRKVNAVVAASTTAAGIVELLTNAELAAGTDTTRAATAASILSLFAASSRTASGYARLPINSGGAFSEIIVQWGTAVAGTGNKSLVLPVAFTTVFAYVNLINNNTSQYNSFETFITSLAGFDYESLASGSTDPRWFAIGY
jgi:hypothetical protein